MFTSISTFIRRMRCSHQNRKFLREVGFGQRPYTDAREVWQCPDCGAYLYKKTLTPRVFSFDVESNGLYGQGFMIAAVMTNAAGVQKEFVARCAIEGPIDPWVAENVLPHVEDVSVTHDSYEAMLEAFYAFYMTNKMGTKIIAHMAFPVEAKLLRDMIELNLGERLWEGPFPLIDVSGVLDAQGFDPTSVDSYNKDHGLIVPFDGVTHHPMYDSLAAEICYRNLTDAW